MASSIQKRKMDFTSDDFEEFTGVEMDQKMRKMSYTCKNCQQSMIVTKEEMRVHYIEAHGKSPVDCDVCQKLFPSQTQVDEHKKAKHNCPCRFPSCTKVFAKPQDLENHTKSCHGDGIQLKCGLCPELAFDTERNLWKHITEIHEANVDANIRQCSICQYKATGEEDLAKHSQIHVPQKCKECGENFPTRGQLDSHRKKTRHDPWVNQNREKKKGFK